MRYYEVLEKLDDGKKIAFLPHWDMKVIKKVEWNVNNYTSKIKCVDFIALVDSKIGKMGPFSPHPCDLASDEWIVL